MADVRLTATNPQDSSVVPVACNSKGELLLEQPPEPTPEFDGNLDGDLTVTGKGTFSGNLATQASANESATLEPYGVLKLNSTNGAMATANALRITFQGNEEINLKYDGSASFANGIAISANTSRGLTILHNANSGTTEAFQIRDKSNNNNCTIFHDGSATIANGKAGFTSEGYFWCTTRRGDRVMLDATSNGLGSWVEYPQVQTQDL